MKPNRINVLIACEESQAECLAFREMGFNAYSCDLQKARFKPQYHILDDVTPYLAGKSTFKTQDGKHHTLKRWHLVIAHPPLHLHLQGIIRSHGSTRCAQSRKVQTHAGRCPFLHAMP